MRSQGWTCKPCCRVRDCGGGVVTCQYVPEDDICPDPDTGCPLNNVETRYTQEKLRRKCVVDTE